MPEEITSADVIWATDATAKQAADQLSKNEKWLHDQGYHQWSAAVSNMRTKIETALHELVEEVSPKE